MVDAIASSSMDLTALLVGLAIAWAVLVALLWLLRPRGVSPRELVAVVPVVARLCRDLLVDRTTPLGVRIAISGLLLWLISPIDLVPDVVPLLGVLDDVVVTVLVLRYLRRRLGAEVLRVRWRGTPEGFALLRGVMG
jgi:uncharacterized membrane protein YkvA (DUF1232 family)